DKELNCITINNDKGVYEAIKHFHEMGHKNIGYLHIGDNANNFMERYYSFYREMKRFNLEVNPEHMIEISTEGGEAVYRELKQKLTKMKNFPTAFFADNDIVAMFAMRALRELGVHIPEDVSIIGFDNMSLSEMLDTPLTTIQVQKTKMGVIAANTIIDLREEIEGFVKIEVGAKLIKRSSVRDFMKDA
ncbi:MAG: transcriptional regulator, LacI family, partial [Anaerocolumna sp.]|nr:transcriptional regulator, LacI family [Anaerocolumna sp.]